MSFQWSSNSFFTDTLNASSMAVPDLYVSNARQAVYYLRAKNDYCVLTDSLKVRTSLLILRPLDDDTLCLGDSACYRAMVLFTQGDTLSFNWKSGLEALSEDTLQSFCVRAMRDASVSLEVRNQIACTVKDTFLIKTDTVLLDLLTENVMCHGMHSGSASLHTLKGFGPFRYNWTPAVSQTDSACCLAAGEYDAGMRGRARGMRSVPAGSESGLKR